MKMKNLKIESAKEYIDDFLPTLSNFCSKAPLTIEIKYVKDLNKVFLKYDDNTLEVNIDITKNKKEVIKEIKEELQKDYPYIYEKKVVVPNAEEVESLVDKGVSISDALNQTTVDLEPKYQIIRVHHKYNEVDLLELKTNLIYKFKSKIPIVKLLEMAKYKDDSILDNLTVLYRIDNRKEKTVNGRK